MNATQEKELLGTLDSMVDLLGLSAELEVSSSEKAVILNLKSEDPGRIIGRNGQTIDAMQLLINKMLRRSEDRIPPIILDVEGYKKAKKERRNSKRRNASTAKNSNAEKPAKAEKGAKEEKSPKGPKASKAPKTEAKSEKSDAPKGEGKKERGPRKPRNNNRPRREGGKNGQSRLSEDREEAIKKQAVEASKEVKRWGEAVILPPMTGAERRLVHLTLEHDPEVATESGDVSQNGKKRVIVRSR